MLTSTENISITVGEGTAKKEFSLPYHKVSFESLNEILEAASSGKISQEHVYLNPTDEKLSSEDFVKRLVTCLNYGADLKARGIIRPQVVKMSEGPEKAFEKQVKLFMETRAAMGKTVTRERAIELVKAMFGEE